jgi:hypothetical protein
MIKHDYLQVLKKQPLTIAVFELSVEPNTLELEWLPKLGSKEALQNFKSSLQINDELWLFPSAASIFYHAKTNKFFTNLPIECIEFVEYRQIPYSLLDKDGTIWRFEGSRPVSKLADDVMAEVMKKTKE